MSSPRPKVNPPLCGICMSSVDVRQEPDGGWHCRKQRCFRQRMYKPIMVTEIEKDEPVSLGLMNRLLTFLTRDIDEDRRPKHPRPEFPSRCSRSLKNTGVPRPKPPQPAPPPCPQVSRPGLHHIVLRNGSSIAIPEDIDHKDKMRSPKDMDVGRPPRGGSGALPAPRPDCPKSSGRPFQSGRDDLTEPSSSVKCPRCKGEKHEDVTDYSNGAAFAVERFICESCGMAFTYEDVVIAEKKAAGGPHEALNVDGIGIEAPAPIQINVAGFIGDEAELASRLSEVIKIGGVSVAKMNENLKGLTNATNQASDAIEDLGDRISDAEELLEEEGSTDVPRDGSLGDLLNELAEDSKKKDLNQIPTEQGWSKRETEPAPKMSSGWWTGIKWIIGVGASIGLGWLAEWAFF